MVRRVPLTPSSDALVPYHDGLARGELRVTRCTACGQAQFPPRAVCPACSAVGSAEWFTTTGRGRVWSYVVFHKAYLPEPAPQPPYEVAVVQLDEGPKLISNVVSADGAGIQVGMAVEAVFDQQNGTAVVKFRPSPNDASPSGAGR
jgi:uncharacterized protein